MPEALVAADDSSKSNADRAAELKAKQEQYERETQMKQDAYLKSRRANRASQAGLPSDYTGIRGNQVIDFDSPRLSPYEDKKSESPLVPLRRPPTLSAPFRTNLMRPLTRKGPTSLAANDNGWRLPAPW